MPSTAANRPRLSGGTPFEVRPAGVCATGSNSATATLRSSARFELRPIDASLPQMMTLSTCRSVELLPNGRDRAANFADERALPAFGLARIGQPHGA